MAVIEAARPRGVPFFVKRWRTIWLFAGLHLVVAATACGYGREARGVNLEPSIHRVAIPVFRNDTYEAGLESVVTDAIRGEFLLHRFVELANVEDADAVLVGVIRKFNTKPISFSRSDFAVEYRASMQVHVKIVLPDGRVIWNDRNIAQIADYQAPPDIFESEANKKSAIRSIADRMADDLHARIFDGFAE
ncbi:MAG: hypothetical protein KJ042_02925 [Deltaproteobacteria bacterium]|nr:hypothetical protein [Deltaproteobacteria bacterium]